VCENGITHAVDIVDQARAQRLSLAPNVRIVRRRKDKRIMEVHILSFGDDSKQAGKRGNPLSYSNFVRQETEYEPTGMWALKHLANETAPLFDEVVRSCIPA
jgi:hypothetical protein